MNIRHHYPTIKVLITAMMLAVCQGLSQPLSLETAYAPALNPGAFVYVVTLQPDGKALIGGSFTSIGPTAITNLARLNVDGTLDGSFHPGAAVDLGSVNTIAVQPDGKILAGGSFSSSSQSTPPNLVRLNTNGTVDATFDNRLEIDAAVNIILVEPSGKILFGGPFVFVDGLTRRSVARLNSDGTLDVTFDACVASSAGSGGTGLILLSDGKILASGNFTFSTGSYRLGIARLGECGEFDPAYAPLPNMNDEGTAFGLALRSSGKALLIGKFLSFHDVGVNSLVQLTTNGVPDGNFTSTPGTEAGATIYALALQQDGKVIVGGEFGQYNNQAVNRLCRINTNGTLDVAAPGTGPNNSVSWITIQEDGKILVAGKFNSINGTVRNGLARLHGDPMRPKLLDPRRLANGQFRFLVQGEPGSNYVVQVSSNLINWASLTNFVGSNNPVTINDPGATALTRRWYRASSL